MVSTILEIASLAAIVAGVGIIFGTGALLVAAGAAGLFTSWRMAR